MKLNAQAYIEALQLAPHPEGGFYKETYRSDCVVHRAANSLSTMSAPRRAASTGIYFLLEQGNFSAFHRIASDEMWHFYAGDTLEVIEFLENGELVITCLGPNISNGEKFQHVVKAQRWFAARVAVGGAFALVGCTVAPGFEFSDFQLANRAELSSQFPAHQAVIAAMTR